MKLATTTGDFRNYVSNQIDAFPLLLESGFCYLDYNFHIDRVRGDGVFGRDHLSYFGAVKEKAEKIGVKLVQAHAPMGDPIADGNEAFIEDTLRCVDASGAWGIPNLVIHMGYLPGLTVEETFKRNKEFFSRVLERAEIYGLNILVENFNKMCWDDTFWVDNAKDLLDLIKYVDHPLLHAVWDTGHANLQNMPQHEELSLLGGEVRALHVHDNGGEWDQHLMAVLGTMNMDSVMRGLFDIGYNGYFTFEVADPFKVAADRRGYSEDQRLASTPLSLKLAWEKSLYELGRSVLSAYGIFEE